jgi:hypothetical protein
MEYETEERIEELLLKNGLAFVSKIAATSIHELYKVVSSSQKSAGDLEKTLIDFINGTPLDSKILQSIADELADDSEQGLKLIKALNSFSRNLENDFGDFEINSLLENVVYLTQKIADLRKFKLLLKSGKDQAWIYSNPFYVQQTIYEAIKNIMSACSDGDSIIIAVDIGESDIGILIKGRPVEAETDLDISYLRVLIERVGGELKADMKAEHIAFELLLPR